MIAQLLGTSLWFSINGVWLSYAHTFELADSHLGYLTLSAALAAVNAPVTSVGSSLAMMNAIGFALTLPSIWITSLLWNENSVWVVLWLLPGPVMGFWALQGLRNTEYAQ